jgi:toxin-antitoxin system PIN domain toxin
LLAEWANGTETIGLAGVVLSGFLRLATNRRVFIEPTEIAEAWDFVDRLMAARSTIPLVAGPEHWTHVRALCHDIDARGGDIADAYLAAFALDSNATLISADRGFARFDRVRWQHPLDR